MQITLCNTVSEKNRIVKTLTSPLVLTGTLRDSSSVINPSFLIESSEFIDKNYCYIPDFNRYYYIDDIIAYRKNMWLITCSIDVLMSYSADIKELYCIIEGTEINGANPYLTGDMWKAMEKDKTDIITFPGGLLENGEYILITAGGVAAL